MDGENYLSIKDALDHIRIFIEDSSVSAYKLVTGNVSLPNQTHELSDEVIKDVLRWIEIFNLRKDQSQISADDLVTIRRLAEERGVQGLDADADVSAFVIISELYSESIRLQTEPPSPMQLETISQLEKRLEKSGGVLSEAQQNTFRDIKITLAEHRAKILADLGYDTAAEAAFLELLDMAKAADKTSIDVKYHRRALLKFCDWLSRIDADETLRWILPILAEDTQTTSPDIDAVSLHTLLAIFFNRYSDRMETEVHLARLTDALQFLGLDELSFENIDSTLAIWSRKICEHTPNAIERFRLFNTAIVGHHSIAAITYQGPHGTEQDNAQMLAIIELVSQVGLFEQGVRHEDQLFLEGVGETVDDVSTVETVDSKVDDIGEFDRLMEANQGDNPAEAAQVELLDYSVKKGLDPELKAHALMRLGHISFASGDWPKANDRYETACAIGRENGIEDIQVDALQGLGMVKFAQEEYAQSSALAGSAIALVEAMREKLRAPYLASTFLADKFSLYLWAVSSARRSYDVATMLARIELVKARALQIAPGAIAPQIRETTRKTLVALREEANEQESVGNSQEQQQSRRRATWEAMTLANEAKPDNFDLAKLQARLGEHTAVINYFFYTESMFLVTVITAQNTESERIRIQDTDLFYQWIARLQDAHHGAVGIGGSLRRLASIVLPPMLDPIIEQTEQLIFCAHQSLHSVPFAALPWKGEPLVQNKDVGMVPNLTCLGRDDEPASGAGLFAMATKDTAVMPNRPLKHAETELDSAMEIWAGAAEPHYALRGSDLTLQHLHDDASLEALSDAAVVHIGTHGSDVNEPDAMRAPMEAYLCLHDTILDGMEISTMVLKADVVVLAACHAGKRAISARGLKNLPSDAVYGLQSAFHSAGARSLIGAMWVVDDETTATITKLVHEALVDHKTPVQALRYAINHFRSKANLIQSDPSFWGAYSIIAFGPRAFGLV